MNLYHVRLNKENLVFSAAHFITFNRDVCERIHGHNYRVEAEVSGPLDENQYVVDFIALRDTLQEILSELDHRMLVPTQHPLIECEADSREVQLTFEDRRWIFPREDCVLLPVANTTAELLAKHIGEQLRERLDGAIQFQPARLCVAVDENFGQWGIWELDAGPAARE